MSVRVRFAPSPSGELHVGSVRTALFNWLFARHHGGVFVLRIEDTDAAKARPEMIEPILEGMRWLGLDWDEGPDIGGPYGPYRQSERRDHYAELIERLIQAKGVYPCFCTPDDVKARGVSRGYDRHCRGLADGWDRVAAGETHVLRALVADEGAAFDDLIRGRVHVEAKDLQDFVVRRSDGSATFQVANVADDLAMAITHAVRGEDILSSALQNVVLYEALGQTSPIYAHLPVILHTDRSKLSKRKHSASVHSFRAAGYLPEAFVNFLALLGWSSPTLDEFLDRERLISEFTLDRVLPHGAVFDRTKLDWMNAEYIKKLPPREMEARVIELYPDIPREPLRRAVDLELLQTRVQTLSEVPTAIHYLHSRPDIDPASAAKAKIGTPESDQVLKATAHGLRGLEDWSVDAIDALIRGIAEEVGLNMRKATAPIRVAVSGSTISLPLFESILIIGREESVARLEAACTEAR